MILSTDCEKKIISCNCYNKFSSERKIFLVTTNIHFEEVLLHKAVVKRFL